MLMEAERKEIVKISRFLFDKGFVQLSGGNVSMRDPNTQMVAIKPSGIAYNVMTPEDVIICDLDGNVIEGELKPSIETGMHTGVYKARQDVNAVIHCHAIYSTAWSIKGKKYIPSVIVSQYVTNGAIKVAAYGHAGSKELARNTIETLGQDYAVAMYGHGILCCGPDMQWALEATLVTEDAAKISFITECIPGDTHYLDREISDAEGFDALARIRHLM